MDFNFNVNTTGVDTQIVEFGSRYIDVPSVNICKIVGIVPSVSKNKGTPAIELIFETKAPENFKPYEQECPTDRRLNQEDYKVKVPIAGPIATITLWVSDKTMDITSPNSSIQKLMQIADACEMREEFDAALAEMEENSIKGFAKALSKALLNKSAAFLFARQDREYLDEASNTIKVAKSTELPFGTFAVPVSDIQDLRKKFEEQGERLVKVERTGNRPSDNGPASSGAKELVDF